MFRSVNMDAAKAMQDTWGSRFHRDSMLVSFIFMVCIFVGFLVVLGFFGWALFVLLWDFFPCSRNHLVIRILCHKLHFS